MNRNIFMLLAFTLVAGTALIAYNKWMMHDAYSMLDNTSFDLEMAVDVQQNSMLGIASIETSTPDIIKAGSDQHERLVTVGNKSATAVTAEPAIVSQTKIRAHQQGDTPRHMAESKSGGKAATQGVPEASTSSLHPKRVRQSAAQRRVKTLAGSRVTALPQLVTVVYKNYTLQVIADKKITYKIFALKKPDRVVVDVVGHFTKALPSPRVSTDSLVKIVRLGHHADRIRIVLDLKRKKTPKWAVTRSEKSISVVIQ